MDAERLISLGLKVSRWTPKSRDLAAISDMGDAFVAQDIGYNYVNFDFCYAESRRSADGQIVAGEEDALC